MIYTCTMNPSVDYKIKLDEVKLNHLNRFESKSFVAGGKGINCSIVLSNLGLENQAITFLGGFTGSFIQAELQQKNINLKVIPIDEETRMNIKIKTINEETEFNHNGPKIEEKDFEKLLEIISSFNKEDILIVGGSGLDSISNAYLRIAKRCIASNVLFVMDTPARYIKEYIHLKPLLMKPNLVELEEYFETKIHAIDEIIFYGKKLINEGATHLIISLGHEGSLFINKDSVYRALPIDGNIVSTTGAGDSMVAGFIYQYTRNQNVFDAYQIAVAASLATVFEPTLATKENMLKHLKNVVIKEILC